MSAEEIGYRYAYRVRQGPATLVRASFNDLPFYREPSHSFADTAARADHLLIPGENTMTIELWDGPKAPEVAELLGPVWVGIYEVDAPGPEGDDPTPIASIRWPDCAMDRKDDKPVKELPFKFSIRFQMPEDHLLPYHLAAFPRDMHMEAIPEQGTPDLREAVTRLHDALMRQQPRLFVDEMQFRFEEQRRYYPTDTDLSTGSVLPSVESRFKQKLQVEPLPPDQLFFESRAQGRVALAMRRDGMPVLWAQGIDEQGHMNMDPMFVRRDGRWTLYR